MQQNPQVTLDGTKFSARQGALLLDAALSSGIDLPFDCRAGHCGTCCVRVLSGAVQGGEGSEPGVVHACQCRIIGDIEIEKLSMAGRRTVEGVVRALIPLSPEVVEVRVETAGMFPYHAGQYARVEFKGFPGRPFSLTHALRESPAPNVVCFHVRRMRNGVVTSALGRSIRPGHRVTLTGPLGSAYFRPDLDSRLVLVATSTGFAPIWSIAVAALHENPLRSLTVIAGGRALPSLYMGPALAQLARFPNVDVTLTCSGQHTPRGLVRPGRPTDYLPYLSPGDVVHVCGAPSLVDAVKAVSAHAGAVCYADPFMISSPGQAEPRRGAARAMPLPRTTAGRPFPRSPDLLHRREPSLPQHRSF